MKYFLVIFTNNFIDWNFRTDEDLFLSNEWISLYSCATFKNTTTAVPLFPKTRKYTSYIRYTSNESFFFFPFLYFISELTHYENQRILLSRLPKNNDPRFYLFPVSGIECPVCTNVPGLGAGSCDSGKVANVTCPDGLNQCMTLKGKMMGPVYTQDIKLKNCSSKVLCDSASDYNGKNITATNLPRPSQPPSEGDSHVHLYVGDAGRSWCKSFWFWSRLVWVFWR